MRPLGLFALGIFFWGALLFSQEPTNASPHSPEFKTSLQITLKNGAIHELVYPAAATANPYYSHLEWNLKNIFFLQLNLEVRFLQKYFFLTQIAVAINRGWGEMHNYDWYDLNRSEFTHYSRSHSWLTGFSTWVWDSEFGIDWLQSPIRLASLLGFHYSHWELSDEILRYDYPNEEGDFSQYLGVKTVSYSIDYLFPKIGILLEYNFWGFTVGGSLQYGFLSYITAVDHHHLRNIKFEDTLFPGHYLSPEIYLHYRWGRINFELGFTYEKMFETRGYTVDSARPKNSVSNHGSGNSFEFFNLNLGVGILY